MQTGTNDMKFANLATENDGRNIVKQGLTNRVSGLPGQSGRHFRTDLYFTKCFSIYNTSWATTFYLVLGHTTMFGSMVARLATTFETDLSCPVQCAIFASIFLYWSTDKNYT